MYKTIILIYFAVITFVSFFLTMYDKLAAVAGKRRIPESVLLVFGALGGALGMFVTMKLIRHKTKKKKFMITLPILAVFHIAFIVALFFI